jgi:FixJ family two-component response regulator
MKAGAVEFLTKLCGEDVLLGAIQNAIERSSAALAKEAGTRVAGRLRIAQPRAAQTVDISRP